jgi:hypothetical protein
MSAADDINAIRSRLQLEQGATDSANGLSENPLDKEIGAIWEALDVLARKIDQLPAEASKKAIEDINFQARVAGF